MGITKEHYRDFIGALAHKKAEIMTEIKAFEHMEDRGEEFDISDEYEYSGLLKEWSFYDKIQRYFMDNHEVWSEFKGLEWLKSYVYFMRSAFDSMEHLSFMMLPEECGELVGTTDEEWDAFEGVRYKLKNKYSAWSTFADFCEHGEIV